MKKWVFIGLSCIAPLTFAHIPESALEACLDLSNGDRCAIEVPSGTISGRCRDLPQSHGLACAPERKSAATPSERGSIIGRPPARKHRVVQSNGLQSTVPADRFPITFSQVNIRIQGPWRIIEANGISEHKTGVFPNTGNPHKIEVQRYRYRLPATPEIAANPTAVSLQNFGIGLNGVPFDPSAAEWYLGNRGRWRYEALSGAVSLGVDDNFAHVQPNGAYHYHGIPIGLLARLNVSENEHSPLIGWAADGFPIYALYGHADGRSPDSGIVPIKSSYRVKLGKRPRGGKEPGGYYDGTFVDDYHYVAGSGTLDECNGRRVQTPEFPNGTYAYFLTEDWPIIPRCYKGTPSQDFRRGPSNNPRNGASKKLLGRS
ncbi:YHYH protein [Microbulbifer sp. OS29]|uniref:YHYH protein n=1 Tax=Microbulbifer okhotskensis TaxID=2926617 RepID=A0A9X2ENN8_9GAMM|nr:YHYH protein [Microbulbifer okhotskensis]MCO1335569.1 YHYH protein [Microbulbifer okhotskensis]